MGPFSSEHCYPTALRITAEVMNWVYSSGTEKPRQALVAEQMMPEIVDDVEYLEVGQSSVVLTIFTAEVGVKLSEKISMELHRSTKKNPPRALKYELIYVRHLLPTPVTGYTNTAFRRERTSMMQARKRTTLNPGQPVAFSKDCVRTWMGKRVFQLCTFSLTLVQVWLRSCVHRKSFFSHTGLPLTWK